MALTLAKMLTRGDIVRPICQFYKNNEYWEILEIFQPDSFNIGIIARQVRRGNVNNGGAHIHRKLSCYTRIICANEEEANLVRLSM